MYRSLIEGKDPVLLYTYIKRYYINDTYKKPKGLKIKVDNKLNKV